MALSLRAIWNCDAHRPTNLPTSWLTDNLQGRKCWFTFNREPRWIMTWLLTLWLIDTCVSDQLETWPIMARAFPFSKAMPHPHSCCPKTRFFPFSSRKLKYAIALITGHFKRDSKPRVPGWRRSAFLDNPPFYHSKEQDYFFQMLDTPWQWCNLAPDL